VQHSHLALKVVFARFVGHQFYRNGFPPGKWALLLKSGNSTLSEQEADSVRWKFKRTDLPFMFARGERFLGINFHSTYRFSSHKNHSFPSFFILWQLTA
jgi:hypothetical protein